MSTNTPFGTTLFMVPMNLLFGLAVANPEKELTVMRPNYPQAPGYYTVQIVHYSSVVQGW